MYRLFKRTSSVCIGFSGRANVALVFDCAFPTFSPTYFPNVSPFPLPAALLTRQRVRKNRSIYFSETGHSEGCRYSLSSIFKRSPPTVLNSKYLRRLRQFPDYADLKSGTLNPRAENTNRDCSASNTNIDSFQESENRHLYILSSYVLKKHFFHITSSVFFILE